MAVSLARRTLVHEWRRFTAAIAALALAGLLILVQVALTFGMFDTYTVTINRANADLWVTSPDVQSFDSSMDVAERFEGRFWAHPDIAEVATVSQLFGTWRAGTIQQQVMVIGLPERTESPANLLGFTAQMLAALREPGSIYVDRADANKLGVRPGDFAEINRNRVRVIGLVDGYRSAFGAYAFASRATLRLLGDDQSATPFYLLTVRDGVDPRRVRDSLRPHDAAAPYTVWLAADLIHTSQNFWLLESGSGASFAFSGFIALLVGMGVTSQTLRGAVLSQLRELAALRALGVGAASLRAVVVEQAAWVGLVAVISMLALSGVSWLIGHATAVALRFPLWTLVAGSVGVVVIALISSLFAIRALYRSEPVELLR
jgi:putative ABC transport system permease protein